MLSFYQGFFGNDATLTVDFVGSDHEGRFKENLNTQPDDWYYRTRKITYSYNSLGHRCKDVKDIDLDNYLLFAGCSHAEGIGLELEKTYSYRVAEMLGCDYYNLALGGSGIDLMTHNLTMWNNYVPKKPKALIILWPHETRFLTTGYNECIRLHIMPEKNDDCIRMHLMSDRNDKTRNFIVAGTDVNFFNARKQFSEILISNLYDGCKIIHAGWNDYPRDLSLWLGNKDFARDLAHSGIEDNEKFAVEIAELLR
jgi:hypothetical protein